MPYSSLRNEPRLLLEATLQPQQGHRFQPTGFPDLGHAVYPSPSGDEGDIVVVESAQSMANRLEAVCWDEESDDWVKPLQGLPVVKVMDTSGKALTNSVLEAHRLNSSYILPTSTIYEGDNEGELFLNVLKERLSLTDTGRVDLCVFAKVLLEFDINALLHGVFLARKEIGSGRLRLPRVLSAFIEATGALQAVSGGVKMDPIDPTGKTGGGADEGFGHVPFSRVEWVAKKITAYFNIDLLQIRAFNLGADGESLLIAIALFKIQKFLHGGLRLRTACDLNLKEIAVTRPDNFQIPDIDDIERQISKLVKAAHEKKLFGDEKDRTVVWKTNKKRASG